MHSGTSSTLSGVRVVAAPQERDGATRSLRVLVIDDDTQCTGQLRSVLSAAGLRVIGRASAEAGLRVARRGRIDVVLTALELPGMTGFDALSELRADPVTQDLPLLVISERQGARTRAASFAAGADCFLTKPLCADEVRAAVLSSARRASRARDPRALVDTLARLLRAAELARRALEHETPAPKQVRDGRQKRPSDTARCSY